MAVAKKPQSQPENKKRYLKMSTAIDERTNRELTDICYALKKTRSQVVREAIHKWRRQPDVIKALEDKIK